MKKSNFYVLIFFLILTSCSIDKEKNKRQVVFINENGYSIEVGMKLYLDTLVVGKIENLKISKQGYILSEINFFRNVNLKDYICCYNFGFYNNSISLKYFQHTFNKTDTIELKRCDSLFFDINKKEEILKDMRKILDTLSKDWN